MKLRAAREKKMEQISANEIMEKTQLKKKTKHKHKIFAQDVKEQLYLLGIIKCV